MRCHVFTDTSKADLAKPNSDLSQRKLTVAKTTPVTTQFAPPATTTRDTKAIADTKLNAIAPTERISEAASDTRLSQALQAWKENPHSLSNCSLNSRVKGTLRRKKHWVRCFGMAKGRLPTRSRHAFVRQGCDARESTMRRNLLKCLMSAIAVNQSFCFYLEEFDGGSLKWTEKVCPAPDLVKAR